MIETVLRAIQMVAVAVAAAAGGWVLVITTATALGVTKDTVPIAGGVSALLFIIGLSVEVAKQDRREQRLTRFGLAMRRGSDLIQDVRKARDTVEARAELEDRWVRWDGETSTLVDRDGREGDHDLYHRPLPSGYIGHGARDG
jgi:hypothetical protein